jgi:hypothetical protein
MTSYKVPQGTVDAARALLSEGHRLNVHQVHSIALRDIDANADAPRIVHLIPLGGVIGVAITADGEWPKDADITFISARALGNTLPALGYTAHAPAVAIVAPTGALDAAS